MSPAHYGGSAPRGGQIKGQRGERQTAQLNSGVEDSRSGEADEP